MTGHKIVTACCEPAVECCEPIEGCCTPGYRGMPRRFISKQEKRENLERYRDALTRELQGVEEALAELAD